MLAVLLLLIVSSSVSQYVDTDYVCIVQELVPFSDWYYKYRAIEAFNGVFITTGEMYLTGPGYDNVPILAVENSFWYQYVDVYGIIWGEFWFNYGGTLFLAAKQAVSINYLENHLCTVFVPPTPLDLIDAYAIFRLDGIGFYTMAYLFVNASDPADKGKVDRTEWFSWDDQFSTAVNVATTFTFGNSSQHGVSAVQYYEYTPTTLAYAVSQGMPVYNPLVPPPIPESPPHGLRLAHGGAINVDWLEPATKALLQANGLIN